MSRLGLDQVETQERPPHFSADPASVAGVTGMRRAGSQATDTAEQARDRLVAELLQRPAVRAAVAVPAIVGLVFGILDARIVEPELFIALVAVAIVLAVGSLVVVRPGPVPPSHQTIRVLRIWQLTSALAGTALLAPFLNVALEAAPARFAPVIAIVLVAQVYSLPRRLCVPLCGWTLLIWLLTLVWGGEGDVVVLWLHLGGGILVVSSSLLVADRLAATLRAAQASRDDAQHRAALLSSVLRMRSLDPDEVLREVAEGMSAVGFDVAVIRRVDLLERTVTLIAEASRGALDVRDTLPLDMGLFGVAASQGEEILVDELDDDPRAVDHGYGLRGTILLPLKDDGQVVAIVSGASLSGPLSDLQLTAVRQLAAEAERALVRARAYTADRRRVEELRRLDLRTRDFVSTVAHELRTPLTVIQGLGQMLRHRWEELPEPRRIDLLRRIDANAERLAGMVRSLLDTSVLEHGEFDLQLDVVDLHDAVCALIDRLGPFDGAFPVTVRIDRDLQAEVDPDLFDHVLENLLTNVAKHTPQGTEVTISAVPCDDRVVISVEDDGPGIQDRDLPHVFDRFYRGGDPDSRGGGGLGLGLALAGQIVEAHGGELTVMSRPGYGSAFRFSVAAAN
jgi:signal transduction histidine kinase